MSSKLPSQERIDAAARKIEPLTDEQISRVCQIMRGNAARVAAQELVQEKDAWDV